MYEICIILRFEIVVFSAMGPCSLNGQHRWFSLELQLPSSDGLCRDPKCSSKPFINMYVYGVLINPHCQSSPLSAHQILYQQLLRTETLMEMSYWGTELQNSSIYFTYYLISHTFPPTVYTVIYCLKKTVEANHFQYKYIFYDQEHILVVK